MTTEPVKTDGETAPADKGPVTMMKAPMRLEYEFTPGVAQSKNLHGLEQGKFIGQRCPKCKKVYTPFRGVFTGRRGADRGGRRAAQHRDGDDLLRGERPLRRPVHRDPLHLRGDPAGRVNLSFMGLIQEVQTDQVRMGMRVEAVWVSPTSPARPWRRSSTSAPTASRTPTTRPTRSTCDDVPRPGVGSTAGGVGSFAQYDDVCRESARNEVEMLMPVVAEVFGAIGITKDDVGFICLGSTDYLIGGPFS